MKINKKYHGIIFSFFVALGISFVISFIITLIHFGFSYLFLTTWLKNWGIAFICALPLSYYYPGLVMKFMNKYFEFSD